MTGAGDVFQFRRRAFSLLELLFVLVIAAALTAAALAGLSSMMQSTALSTGAERLQETLGAAQHAAVTQNVSVEVRFYVVPGTDGAGSFYRVVQAHALNADGTITPISPVMTLPANVTIDPTAAHSPLLGSNTETATADKSDPLLDGQTSVFHFLPDGSTDLDASTSWFMTLRAATASDPAHFPSNWVCLSLDPTTGRVQIYRP
jgi:uncharacterized protein (TIGR02596 family)